MRRFLLTLMLLAAMMAAPRLCATVPPGAAAALTSARSMQAEYRYDSVLALLRPLAMAYDPAAPRATRLQSLDAIYGCADAAMRNNRHAPSLEYLFLAQRVTDSDPSLPRARLHLLYTNIYIVLASHCQKESYLDHAIPHALKAFELSMEENDMETTYRAYGDLAHIYQIKGTPELMAEPERRLRELLRRHPEPLLMSALAEARARSLQQAGRYAESDSNFTEALRLLPRGVNTAAYRSALLQDRALLRGPTDLDAALRDLDEAARLNARHNIRWQKFAGVSTYRYILENNASVADDDPRLLAVKREQKALQDSLQAYAIADDVLDFESVREREMLENRLDTALVRSRMLLWGGLGALVIAAGAAAFLIVLRRKNRILHRRALMLRQRVRELYNAPKPEEPPEEKSARNTAGENGEGDGGRGRVVYALNADERAAIVAGIRKALARGDAFSPDFSLTSLSVALGRHHKAVSQVIHDEFDCSFPTLVNRTRVLEACRRIDSPEYARLTTEAIGESVGFNSRSAFNNNFRRFTGLTIREYRRAGRQTDDRADGSTDYPA